METGQMSDRPALREQFSRIFDEERKMWLLPLEVTSEPAFHDFVYNCMELAVTAETERMKLVVEAARALHHAWGDRLPTTRSPVFNLECDLGKAVVAFDGGT
jgi:hypothetical protein